MIPLSNYEKAHVKWLSIPRASNPVGICCPVCCVQLTPAFQTRYIKSQNLQPQLVSVLENLDAPAE